MAVSLKEILHIDINRQCNVKRKQILKTIVSKLRRVDDNIIELASFSLQFIEFTRILWIPKYTNVKFDQLVHTHFWYKEPNDKLISGKIHIVEHQ